MRRAVLFFALACSALAAEPQVRTPQKPVEVGTITLVSGRVLHDAAVVGDTAETITIKHDGSVEKIAKAQLPAEILRRWPVDPVRLAKEEKARAQAEANAKLAAENKIKRAEFEKKVAADEAAYRARIADQFRRDNPPSPNTAPLDPAAVAQARRDAIAAELAQSRDSVRILGFGFYPAKNALIVKLRNPGENDRQLEWRQLRALASDGRVLEPLDVVFNVSQRASYDIDHGAEREFTVVFPSALLAAVSWNDRPDLGWIDPKGAIVTADAAVAAAKDRAIAARQAKRANQLQPSEAQVVQQ